MKLFLLFFFSILLYSNVVNGEEGICGNTEDECNWKYNTDNKTLDIYGNGDIVNFKTFKSEISLEDEVEKIIIHNDIKQILNNAFEGFSKLEKIELPSSVTFIDKNAFNECNKIQSFSFPNSNDYYDSVCETLINKINMEILLYPIANDAEKITIPNEIKRIATDSFIHNQYLETIVLPENMTLIQKGSFKNLPKLKTIIIGANISTIEENAFSSLPSLTRVVYRGEYEPDECENIFENIEVKEIEVRETYFDETFCDLKIHKTDSVFDLPDITNDNSIDNNGNGNDNKNVYNFFYELFTGEDFPYLMMIFIVIFFFLILISSCFGILIKESYCSEDKKESEDCSEKTKDTN